MLRVVFRICESKYKYLNNTRYLSNTRYYINNTRYNLYERIINGNNKSISVNDTNFNNNNFNNNFNDNFNDNFKLSKTLLLFSSVFVINNINQIKYNNYKIYFYNLFDEYNNIIKGQSYY